MCMGPNYCRATVLARTIRMLDNLSCKLLAGLRPPPLREGTLRTDCNRINPTQRGLMTFPNPSPVVAQGGGGRTEGAGRQFFRFMK